MGFMDPTIICGDANLMVPNCTLYEFGVMSSLMHMAWTAAVCGRLEGRYRYSAKVVYNNFPWPKDVSARQRVAIESAAQGVLDARIAHSPTTLADLYDPLTMPADLLRAHHALDRAVDGAYARRQFTSDAGRVAFLLGRFRD